MDKPRHDILDTMGIELKSALTRAAMAAGLSVDAMVQLALGREVHGCTAEQLATARTHIERDGFTSRLEEIRDTWPAPAPAPTQPELGPLPGGAPNGTAAPAQ